MGELVLAAVRGLSQRFDLFQLLASQFVNIFVECQESPLNEQGFHARGAENRWK
jgi:hypothetical protein